MPREVLFLSSAFWLQTRIEPSPSMGSAGSYPLDCQDVPKFLRLVASYFSCCLWLDLVRCREGPVHLSGKTFGSLFIQRVIGFISGCGSGSLVAVRELPAVVARLVAERGLHTSFSSCSAWAQQRGSWAPEHGLSCSRVREIFPDQGSNPHLLHWQVDSLPLSHQGIPGSLI